MSITNTPLVMFNGALTFKMQGCKIELDRNMDEVERFYFVTWDTTAQYDSLFYQACDCAIENLLDSYNRKDSFWVDSIYGNDFKAYVKSGVTWEELKKMIYGYMITHVKIIENVVVKDDRDNSTLRVDVDCFTKETMNGSYKKNSDNSGVEVCRVRYGESDNGRMLELEVTLQDWTSLLVDINW